MKYIKLVLTLLEPATIGDLPCIGNELGTLDYVPGPALRGAIYQKLLSSGKADTGQVERLLGNRGPRWSPAWPCWKDDDKPVMAVPMPRSYMREKRDEGFGGQYGVLDALHLDQLPQNTEQYRERFGNVIGNINGGNTQMQWVRIGSRWLKLDSSGQPLGTLSVPISSEMHVALDYSRQAAKNTALFSQSVIAEQSTFHAYVAVPSNMEIGFSDISGCVVLGKRLTAGNGLAELACSEFAGEIWPSAMPPAGEAYVQLMSDAIVMGTTGGHYRGLDDAAWSRILGIKVEVVAAASSSRIIQGWSGVWGVPRERVTAIEAGSVWRLRSANGEFPQAVRRLQETGIGIRRSEGFGWVAVNPAWLMLDDGRCAGRGSNISSHEQTAQAHAWPGFDAIDSGYLRTLASAARELSKRIKDVSVTPLLQLMAFAERVDTPEQVMSFLNQRADRRNDKAWGELRKNLKDQAGKVAPELLSERAMDFMRFFLNAAVTYAKSGQAGRALLEK